MRQIGVLGGMSAQATIDFEARVHRVAKRLIPQDDANRYPPMVVWYHRERDAACLRLHPGITQEAATNESQGGPKSDHARSADFLGAVCGALAPVSI